MNDAEVLFTKLQADGSAGNESLKKLLGWEADRYLSARNELLADGKIVLGRGRGGSVRLKDYSPDLLDGMQTPAAKAGMKSAFAASPEELGEAAVKAVSSEPDEEVLFSLVPQEGSLSNLFSRKKLGWDKERYNSARMNLIKNSRVVSATALGGGIRLKMESDPPYTESPSKVKEEPTPLDLSLFSSDEEAFLFLVPKEGRLNNNFALKRLGWDKEKYDSVKLGLIQSNKIVMAACGPGGGVRLKTESDALYVEVQPEPQPLDTSAFASDAEALLSLVPADRANNGKLRKLLGWDEARYDAAKTSLLEEKKVAAVKPGGPYGSIRLFRPEDEVKEQPEEIVQPKVEVDAKPKDLVVFSCFTETTAARVVAALRAKYPKTDFYVQGEGELNVYLKKKTPLRISDEVFDRVVSVAKEASGIAD